MERIENQTSCDRAQLRYLADQYMDAWLSKPSMAVFHELNGALVANVAYNKYTPDDPDLIPDLEKALDDYTAAVHNQNSSEVLRGVLSLHRYMATHSNADGPGYKNLRDLKRKLRQGKNDETPDCLALTLMHQCALHLLATKSQRLAEQDATVRATQALLQEQEVENTRLRSIVSV
ncbi:unnamed protein product [Peniophora sp. CBMAI 1063]|nr:unnamed protein product [Peniophora sp. CBMAI 1063]